MVRNLALWTTLYLSMTGCTALLGRPAAAPPKPAAADATEPGGPSDSAEPSEPRDEGTDTEAGVRRLNELLRGFRNALDAKAFDRAETLLVNAEAGVKNAGTITRSHPDFDDVAERVRQARPRLEAARERDRIERRNAAIAALERQGETAMQQAGTLIAELQAHPAQNGDDERLSDAVTTFAQLRSAGEGYLDDAGYHAHADARNAMEQRLIALRQHARLQLDIQGRIASSIDTGIAAANRAKTPGSDAEHVTALQDAANAFGACAQALQQSQGADEGLVIESRLGMTTVARTRQQCAALQQDALTRANRFTWEHGVQQQIALLQSTDASLQAAQGPTEQEAQSRKALDIYQACERNTHIASQQPGYDPTFVFVTPFGKLTAPQLINRCGSEATRLHDALPTLHWQAIASTLPARLTAIRTRLDEAARTEEPGRATEAWSAALGGLQECLARSQELLATPGFKKSVAFATPWGNLTMPAIAQRCSDEKSRADKSLASALRKSQAQGFASTCHGDEVEVVKREGVPTRIDVVPQGRVFVYAPSEPGGVTRRFGFDLSGQRIDFSAQWRTTVEQLVGQLTPAVQAARSARGQAAEQAIETAMPLLSTCQSGTAMARHPGLDETILFATAWGKLNINGLRQACGSELSRLRQRQSSLAWQIRVDLLRERVAAAQGSAQQASSSPLPPPQEQSRLLASASGGLAECSERAIALLHAQTAEKGYRVDSVFGQVTLADLAKACQKAKISVDRDLEKATAAMKLQTFMAQCHGDEIAVVEREGLPGKVESVSQGRIFIYGKRRFAFDRRGARTEEKLLR